MTKSWLGLFAAATLSASPALGDHHAGAMGYALANGGETLAVMTDLAKPTEIETVGLAQPLVAIAYRPVTGDLLGLAAGAVYTIDPTTGAMTDLGAAFAEDAAIAPGARVGLDFNNKIDAVRAVSSRGDNLVYFPAGFGGGDPKAGSVRRFTGLAYADGDPHAGQTPMIFANAYTNAVNGKTAGDTFQYALDAETNALVSLANNAGALKTIGTLTLDGVAADVQALGGFDIVSASEGENRGYAILQLAGQDVAGLYAVNLETAALTRIADLGMGGITGFAASKTK